MKNFYFTVLMLIVIKQVSFGQWVTNQTITSNTTGNVLIGTTASTNGLLQINGTGDLLSLTSTTTSPAQFNSFGSSDFRLIQRSNAIMTFWTNTIERMRLDQNGNVGIGNISPSAKLDVTGTGNFTGNLTVGTTAVGTGFQQVLSNSYYNISGVSYGGQFRWYTSPNNSLYKDNALFQLRAWDVGSNAENTILTFTGNGKLGVGTTSPGAVLSLLNSSPVIQLFDAESNPLDGSSEGRLAFGSTSAEFASIEASRISGSADDLTILKFKTSYATGAGGDGDNIERMRINFNGNVGIGTINPQSKLDVNGTIHSKQVNVDLNNWPDYVFKSNYQLPSLQEIKTYIDQNHHLPEMPSAPEVEKDGLNLGEANKLLTKKVEELTLYLIEQNKRIEKLESQIKTVENGK